MGNYSILDCTLRDGGYINDFNFGILTIKSIINKLVSANTDIIECGFLQSGKTDENRTLFGSVEMVKKCIEPKNKKTLYVAMIAYGDITQDEISFCDGTSIDGIRLTFHKHQIDEAFEFGKELMTKNYKVFMQPVGTTSYTDEELKALALRINAINPYAFYLVDTLGTMFRDDLIKMFSFVDDILNSDIRIGFHSHNNLQMSFANATEMLALNTDRNIIIDSSVFGMGRGAGNLCTELIMKYINHIFDNRYDVVPILEIFDEHINKILLKYKWGYSLPYLVSSVNNCHPNYATHLINKQTISIKEINCLLASLPSEKRNLYDKHYIEKLYLEFQKHVVDDIEAKKKLKEKLSGRNIVLLAPGKSIIESSDRIKEYCKQNNSVVISINFMPKNFNVDYLFVSNQKRFAGIREINEINNLVNVIITSNLYCDIFKDCIVVNYSDYVVDNPIISDNAGIMLINLLSRIDVKQIQLAGFDGFSYNSLDNYYDTDFTNSSEFEELDEKTNAIATELSKFSNTIKINYLTKSRYNDEQI